jgi:hypothetical protein
MCQLHDGLARSHNLAWFGHRVRHDSICIGSQHRVPALIVSYLSLSLSLTQFGARGIGRRFYMIVALPCSNLCVEQCAITPFVGRSLDRARLG